MTTSTTQASQSDNRDVAAPTITERVAAGATLLDEQRLGWEQGSDLDDLAIGECTACNLEQLCGDFGSGLLGLPSHFDSIDHGFALAPSEDTVPLTAEWRRVIEARRAAVA